MKTMTCKQLGGACDEEFRAATFEEMADLSKRHGMAMKDEESHQEAMRKMMLLMQDPEAMKSWMAHKRKLFNELPDDE